MEAGKRQKRWGLDLWLTLRNSKHSWKTPNNFEVTCTPQFPFIEKYCRKAIYRENLTLTPCSLNYVRIHPCVAVCRNSEELCVDNDKGVMCWYPNVRRVYLYMTQIIWSQSENFPLLFKDPPPCGIPRFRWTEMDSHFGLFWGSFWLSKLYIF